MLSETMKFTLPVGPPGANSPEERSNAPMRNTVQLTFFSTGAAQSCAAARKGSNIPYKTTLPQPVLICELLPYPCLNFEDCKTRPVTPGRPTVVNDQSLFSKQIRANYDAWLWRCWSAQNCINGFQ